MAKIDDQTPWEMKDPSPAPASRARRKTREKNRDEYEADLVMPGDVTYNAATIVELDESFGVFARNYEITRVQHIWTPEGGYIIHVHLRGALAGY